MPGTRSDNLVEFAGWLSLLTGSLGKMAQDIILLAQTEVGEVSESAEEGRGGSSTMPQKSNPITSELILAAARTNASFLSAMHQAQIQEHDGPPWLAGGMVDLAADDCACRRCLKNARLSGETFRLTKDDAENITRADDVILAEAAVFALAKAMPRAQADELVKKACAIAVSEGKPLIEVVRKLAANRIADDAIDWQALAAPENYLGETERIIDRVLQSANNLLS
jgi:3-carboxy-cis,cis-muconate cycloisomerase